MNTRDFSFTAFHHILKEKPKIKVDHTSKKNTIKNYQNKKSNIQKLLLKISNIAGKK